MFIAKSRAQCTSKYAQRHLQHLAFIFPYNVGRVLLTRDSRCKFTHGQPLPRRFIACIYHAPASLFRHALAKLLVDLRVRFVESVSVHLH